MNTPSMNSREPLQIRLLLLPQPCTQPHLYSAPTFLSEILKSLKYRKNEEAQPTWKEDVLLDKYYII